MLWQIRRDFISLFTRGTDNKTYLDPIDGLRSIANLSIIFLHLAQVFTALILPYPHQQWQEYLHSAAFALSGLLSLTLEIFFMISGFLLTHKLITQWNKNSPNTALFLQKQYPLLILKRALRFWPGFLLVTLIMLICGEPRYPNSGNLFEFFRYFNIWIFIQNYINLEYWRNTFGALWSISLDMQMYIIMPLILYLFHSLRKFISLYNCLFILLLVSIIRGIIVFDPTTMTIFSIAYRDALFPLLSTDYFNRWMETHCNVTFSPNPSNANAIKLFMHKMYLPLEARFGSFIIGAMLAIKIIECSNHINNKSKTFKKYLFLTLICFQMFTSIQSPALVVPSDIVMKLVVGSIRQIFTIGQAFLLFTALCPSSHPYHAPWIKKFLSLPIWIPISKLSYFVYLIHWRILFELVFGGPLRFLETYLVTHACLISLPIVLIIAEIISCIWYVLAEKPIERVIQVYFEKQHVN